MIRRLRWLVFPVLCLVLAGCQSFNGMPVYSLGNVDHDDADAFMGLPLADGQVVLTESGGAYSVFLALIAEEFYPFTHSGVVALEDGRPYVYEARGVFKPTAGTPAEWFRSGRGVRRVSLTRLLKMVGYLEIYQPPPDVDRQAVLGFLREAYRNKTPFDAYFDYNTRDRLYCTELTFAALKAGGAAGLRPVPNRQNPSVQAILDWWGITADATIPAGYLAIGDYVGSLGRVPDRTAAVAFNSAKKEIHRRFTPDQKLGNVFTFQGGLQLREPVWDFVSAAMDLFDTAPAPPSMEEVDAAVRGLARSMFGTMTPARTASMETQP